MNSQPSRTIDYDQIASEYAQHRRVHPGVLCDLVATSKISSTSKVLELGCGTGNYIAAMESTVGCECWGLDPSEEMLERARKRSPTIHLCNGRAERVNLPDETFDLVFSVDVIHHVHDLAAYFREAYRVLRVEGKVSIATDSEWMIRRREPLATYFPETIDADLARYPRLSKLVDAMLEAGFQDNAESKVEFCYQLTDIQPYRDRAFSVLHLVSQEALREGIDRMEYSLRVGPIQCISRYSLLWATKHGTIA